MDNKEDIIEKIRKLLALSKSDNVHEAELALLRANELMLRHQLSITEVDLNKMRKDELHEGQVIRVSETYRSFMRGIAQAAGTIFDARALGTGTQSEVCFIGQKEDVDNANILFHHLFESWKSIMSRDAKEWKVTFFYPPRQYEVKQYQISHGQGFASAILSRAQKLAYDRKQSVQNASQTGTALVVLKDQLIKQWIDDHCTKGKAKNYKSQPGGYREGYAAGQSIPLGGAICEQHKQIK
jgi:hypothetical protein